MLFSFSALLGCHSALLKYGAFQVLEVAVFAVGEALGEGSGEYGVVVLVFFQDVAGAVSEDDDHLVCADVVVLHVHGVLLSVAGGLVLWDGAFGRMPLRTFVTT